MANPKRGPIRMKPKTPPPPTSTACSCAGTLGIVCKCAGTGTATDWIDDDDLQEIKEGGKHRKS